MVLHVLHIVLPAAVETPENHPRRFHAQGAVCGILDDPGGIPNLLQRFHGGRVGLHLIEHIGNLGQADPAGHAFAAGLRPT